LLWSQIETLSFNQPTPTGTEPVLRVPFWQPMLLAAMAGGMGWGIRGQYGHETGAMIAGLLVSLVLVLLLCPKAALLPAARAIAFGTIAMGFGGSMTYGQTVGLTHDPALVGNWDALRWGMLGLAIKGGIWIGFAGLFLGMGLGGVRYRAREILLLMLGMLGLYVVGLWMLNSPFDPANKGLPRIYFSADWRWQPGAELKPRPEVWGGLLLALLGAWTWAGWFRRDRLARNLALWGALGGLGFPIGQSLQAYHAWNLDAFKSGIWVQLAPAMNWWNWMETTFGAVMGACLGLGLCLNRSRIAALTDEAEIQLKPAIEWVLLAMHVPLLLITEFASVGAVDFFYDVGLVLGLIPMVAVAGGRWWPFLLAFPVTALPIAGKTIRNLVYESDAISAGLGWALYGLLPLAVMTGAAVWFARQVGRELSGNEFARRALLLSAWFYFALNYAFFRFPWPWEKWTPRTPNAIVFTGCVAGLTLACLLIGRRRRLATKV
jgi:hypothetical protein